MLKAIKGNNAEIFNIFNTVSNCNLLLESAEYNQCEFEMNMTIFRTLKHWKLIPHDTKEYDPSTKI